MEKWEYDLGNPQEEAPRRIQKKNYKKRLKWLGIAAAVVLAVVAVALLWDHGSFDGLRRAVIYRQAQKDETGCAQLYRYAVEKSAVFTSLDGSLIMASDGQISVLGEDGAVRYHTQVKFSHAAVFAAGGRAVAYDIGGTEIYVLDSHGLVRQLTCGGEILAVTANEGGMLAATVNKSGYKAAVEVYDAKGSMTFEFDSSDRFVMTAAVTSDGEHLAAVTMGQEDGSYRSSIVFYKLTSETPAATCTLEGGAVYDIGHVGSRLCAVSEDALHFLSSGGKETASYSFGGKYLRRCSLSGDGYAALLLGDYKSGSQAVLATVSSAGSEIARLEISSEVLGISAAGRYIAVLYSDRLTIYDKNWNEHATLEGVSTARQVLMRADGSAVLAGSASASLYLP